MLVSIPDRDSVELKDAIAYRWLPVFFVSIPDRDSVELKGSYPRAGRTRTLVSIPDRDSVELKDLFSPPYWLNKMFQSLIGIQLN